MKFIISILAGIVGFLGLLQMGESKFILKELSYKSNSSYNNYSLEHWKVNGKYYVNGTLYINTEITKATVVVSLSLPKNDKDQMYTNHLPQGSVDLCALSDGLSMNPITKMFLDNYEKYATYKIGCPFKPGYYNIYNYEMNENMIPFPMKSFKFRLTASLIAKAITDRKTFVAFTFKLVGEFKN